MIKGGIIFLPDDLFSLGSSFQEEQQPQRLSRFVAELGRAQSRSPLSGQGMKNEALLSLPSLASLSTNLFHWRKRGWDQTLFYLLC